MAKNLRITIPVVTEVDEQQVDKAFDIIDAGFDRVEAAGQKAFAAVADDVDLVGTALKDLPDSVPFPEFGDIPEIPDFPSPKGAAEWADEFDEARAAAELLLKQQEAALAQMKLAGEEGTDAYLDMVAGVIDTRQELKKMDDVAADIQKMFDDLEPPEPPDDNPWEKFFAFDAIEKAAGFFDEITERGKELRSATANLAAQTGLVGDELDRVADKAGPAFRSGIGENLAEATKIMGVAEQQLGRFLQPEQLDIFTQRAAGIGKVFDKDVNEVLAKSRTFISQFDLKDGAEAGDLLAVAMQKAGGAMDDVLDTTDEYSGLVKQAGFNAEEFITILTDGVQAGARDTDKLGDTIKETAIRLKAGDISTALAGISAPIGDTISEIVKLGEAGTISVKDVMTRAGAEIERAFQAGEITDSMRTQLQVGISGTPAEDLGSDMYGRLFGAPIDTSKIKEQGSLAGEQMVKAIEPTFGARLGKMFESVGDKAAALAAPITSVAGSALGVVGQLGPALSFLKDSDLFPTEKITQFASKLGDLPGIAAKAGPALSSAFTVATGPIGLTVAAIAGVIALLAIFFTQTETGREAWDSITDAVENLWKKTEPILDDIGDALATAGEIAFELLIAPFEFWWGILKGILGAAGNLLASIVGLTSGSDALNASFQFLEDVFAGVKISLEAVLAGIQTLKDGVLDVIGKLSEGDFSGAYAAFTAIGDNTAAAFNNALEDGVREEAGERLQRSLDEALASKKDVDIKLKASIDTNSTLADLQKAENEIEGLQDKLTKAKLGGDSDAEIAKIGKELEAAQEKARGFAEQLQKDAPNAVRVTGAVVDSTGKLQKQYEVNKVKVAEMANAQQEALGEKARSSVEQYSNSLIGVVNQYQSQRDELDQLQEKINKGGASPEMLQRFDELLAKTNESRDAMVGAFEDGAAAGLLSDKAISALAKSLGITEDEARKLAKEIQQTPKAASQGKRDIDALGKSFGDAMQKAQKEVDRLSAAYAEMLRTNQNDPSIIENLRKAQEELRKLQEIQNQSQETPQDIARRAAEKERADAEIAANRAERAAQRNLRLIRDEDERALKEIEATKNAAIKKEQIEIDYQKKLLDLADNENDRQSIRAAIKTAQDNIDAAKQDAQIARADKLGEIAVNSAEEAIAAQREQTQVTFDNLQARLDRLKEIGAQSADALQQQKDLELEIIQQSALKTAAAEIESSKEFTEFQEELLADVQAKAGTADAISTDEVLRRLNEKRQEIADRLRNGTDPAAEAYQGIFAAAAAKGVAVEERIRQEGIQHEIDDVQEKLSRIEGDTLDAIRERHRLELAELDKQQELEREKLISGLLAKEIITIRAKQLSGDITADEANQLIAAARKQIEQLSAEVKDLEDRQKKVRTDLQDTQRKEDQSALLADLRANNAAVAASLSFQEAAYDAFYNHIDEKRKEDLEKSLAAISEQQDALVESYRAGEISVDQLFEKSAALSDQQREIQNELAEQSINFWKDVGEAVAPAFDFLVEKQAEMIDQATKDFEAGTLDYVDLGLQISATLGAVGAQAALEQQNIADAMISAAFDILQRMVPIFSALILGYSLATADAIATLGATALIKWGILTGLLSAGVAAARAATGYKDGGLVRGRKQLAWLNDDPWEREEFVMSGAPTERYTPQFERINKGEDPYEVFSRHRLELSEELVITPDGRLFGFDIRDLTDSGSTLEVQAQWGAMIAAQKETTQAVHDVRDVLREIQQDGRQHATELLTVEREGWRRSDQHESELLDRVGFKRDYTSGKRDLIGAVIELQNRQASTTEHVEDLHGVVRDLIKHQALRDALRDDQFERLLRLLEQSQATPDAIAPDTTSENEEETP